MVFEQFTPAAMSLVFNAMKKWHTYWLRKRLQQHGLQYHVSANTAPMHLSPNLHPSLQDLLTEGPILDKVLARMPADMQEARERRIRRAFDLSLKKVRATPVYAAPHEHPI